MYHPNPGPVTPFLTILGSEQVPVYLLGENPYVLVEGGVAVLAPLLETQFAEHGLNDENLLAQLILHSHWDHCGTLPWVRQHLPGTAIIASTEAVRLWENERYRRFIWKSNRGLAEVFHLTELLPWLSGGDEPLPCDRAVVPGETLEFGDMRLETIRALGHSACGMALFWPERGVLFVSDFAGLYLGKDTVLPLGYEGMAVFGETIETLAALPAEYVCLGHYGVLSGEQARQFFQNARQATADFSTEVQDKLHKPDEADRWVTAYIERHECPRLSIFPRPMLEKEIHRMVRTVCAESGA
jgi:2-aminobenzoylacetyl-CoA thioesterase